MDILRILQSKSMSEQEKAEKIDQWRRELKISDGDFPKIFQKIRYAADFRSYCKECLKIRDKNGNIVALVPNSHQENIIKIVEDWKEEYPDVLQRPTLFIIILKSRQVGFSTIVEALFFHELHHNENKIAMVVSYDDDSARNINDMSDRFYQYLPQDIKPMRRASRGKGILFENDTDDKKKFENDPGLQCKFLIDTARNKNAGSSFTINYLHLSELSKWTDAKATLTSLLQAVPQNGGIVVIESTPNGLEHFHRLWQETKSGELNYKPIFVPWFSHSQYKLDFESEEKKQGFIVSLKEKELRLKSLYGLTYEQLNWRRDTLRKKCQNDENIFAQEYPGNDIECFLTSGRPVFDRQKIEEWRNELLRKYREQPYEIGYVEYSEISHRYEFYADEFGPLKLYERPKLGYPYVMGGDIAEGLTHGDWSVAPVCDNTTGKIVAKLRLHIHPDLFADEQLKLAHFYNDALIANEVNNHGLTTITALQKAGYYNQYRREIYDKISKTKQHKFGFDTKSQSRKKIINGFRAIVRENIEWVTDIDILDEMLTFVYNSDGKEEAEANTHDDCVLSTAIMYEAREQQRMGSPRNDATIKPKAAEMVHYSIFDDTHKNPKLREHYKRMYEEHIQKIHSIPISRGGKAKK